MHSLLFCWFAPSVSAILPPPLVTIDLMAIRCTSPNSPALAQENLESSIDLEESSFCYRRGLWGEDLILPWGEGPLIAGTAALLVLPCRGGLNWLTRHRVSRQTEERSGGNEQVGMQTLFSRRRIYFD